MERPEPLQRGEYPEEVISFGPFRLLPLARQLLRDGAEVPVGSRALDILIALALRPGQVLSNRDLLAAVWPGLTVEEANLRVHVAGLRKALGDGRDGGRIIANIPGRGYCFVARIAVSPRAIRPRQEIQAAEPRNLPPKLARMIGRNEDNGTIAQIVVEHRFATIVGPGGIGKTTCAVAVAHGLFDTFEGQVDFIDLSGVSDPMDLPGALADALRIEIGTNASNAELAARLTGVRRLIVLDNCEHLIDAAALLAEEIFAASSDIHLLATSRERLRAEGEHVHWLPPLGLPRETATLSSSEALEATAVQLFMERAAASGHTAPLSDAEAPVVAEMCRKLEGIPLAIECVAGQVGLHGVWGTNDLLDHQLPLAWRGRRSAAPRHQTLHALLDWSFGLLRASDRDVLRQWTAFSGGFTPAEAAEALAMSTDPLEVARTLERLVEASLVLSSNESGVLRYRIPHITRVYMLDTHAPCALAA